MDLSRLEKDVEGLFNDGSTDSQRALRLQAIQIRVLGAICAILGEISEELHSEVPVEALNLADLGSDEPQTLMEEGQKQR